jgi:hypothetical protein
MRIIRTQEKIPLPQRAAEKPADDAGRCGRDAPRETRSKSDKERGLRDDG